MIFSGSAVVDRAQLERVLPAEGGDRSCLVAVYTGHGHGKQTQNLAYSNDRGRTWTKYAGNPVLDLGLKDFRDPKVFWHEPTRRWIMVTVLADQHKVRFFGSRRPQGWDAAQRLRPGRRHRRRVGVPGPVRAARSRASRADALGAGRRHQSGRRSPAARAASISSARSTARASSTTSPPSGRCGPTTARTSTPRSRSPTFPPPTDAASGWHG